MAASTARIASAPISWGVSEVPEWGHQLAPERVLREMSELGYTATEIGPDGFLPDEPAEKAARLAEFGLTALGSFVPVVLHDADNDPAPRIRRELEAYAAVGADTLILCAVTGQDGYDEPRPVLTEAQWSTLFSNLDLLTELAAEVGVTTALHPHVGSVVESAEEVDRVLNGSRIPFCFDTGHLMIGGTDPVAFAQQHADRIAHTHLKDVSVKQMLRVKNGEISYYQGSIDGLYTPLGQGDVDIRTIVHALLESGYTGWFVTEQDKVLIGGEPAEGEGPIEDARESIEYLNGTIAEFLAAQSA